MNTPVRPPVVAGVDPFIAPDRTRHGRASPPGTLESGVLAGTLDHESIPSFILTVEATDDEGITGEVAVTIDVADVTEPPLRPTGTL